MRTVTMKDLDAMLCAAEELGQVSGKLKRLCAGTAGLTAVSGQTENAVFGLQVAAGANAEYERVLKNFESAAANFLGEGCRLGESTEEYKNRVCSMSERELLATPVRNGLRVDLYPTASEGMR